MDVYRRIIWLDTADLSDYGPNIALQVLQVRLSQGPSFASKKRKSCTHDHESCKRAGCENWRWPRGYKTRVRSQTQNIAH